MKSTDTVRPAWIALYGRDCAERFQALADAAGEDAVHRFLCGKLGAPPRAGLYVRQALENEPGRSIVSQLLNELLQGQLVPVSSVAVYYAHGRQLPAGMQLAGGVLVDVLARPADPPAQGSRHAV